MLSGFPGASALKNPPAIQETQVQSLSQNDPLEEEINSTPVFFVKKFPGQRSPESYKRVTKSWTQLSTQGKHTIFTPGFIL